MDEQGYAIRLEGVNRKELRRVCKRETTGLVLFSLCALRTCKITNQGGRLVSGSLERPAICLHPAPILPGNLDIVASRAIDLVRPLLMLSRKIKHKDGICIASYFALSRGRPLVRSEIALAARLASRIGNFDYSFSFLPG